MEEDWIDGSSVQGYMTYEYILDGMAFWVGKEFCMEGFCIYGLYRVALRIEHEA